MGFEHAHDAFGCIVEIHVGQDKLVVYLTNVFHGPLVPFTGLIVQDLYMD